MLGESGGVCLAQCGQGTAGVHRCETLSISQASKRTLGDGIVVGSQISDQVDRHGEEFAAGCGGKTLIAATGKHGEHRVGTDAPGQREQFTRHEGVTAVGEIEPLQAICCTIGESQLGVRCQHAPNGSKVIYQQVALAYVTLGAGKGAHHIRPEEVKADADDEPVGKELRRLIVNGG